MAFAIVGQWLRISSYDKASGSSLYSPAAICYWLIVSLITWGVLSLVGIYWRPFHVPSAAACSFAMAIGCVANRLKNRSFHCVILANYF